MIFKHEKCECPEGACVKGVAPAEDCVNRLDGVVEGAWCEKCQGESLHHNGNCLRCLRLAREAVQPQTGPQRNVEDGHATRPSLTLRIKCGDEFVVSDRRKVQRLLRILLED